MLVDSVAFLGLSTIELNTLRRDLMKHKLPDHLKHLAKDAPLDSTHLFGDDIQKWINQIVATNTALQKSSTHHGSSQRQFSRQSNGYQGRSTRNLTKNYYAPRGALLEGRRAATSRLQIIMHSELVILNITSANGVPEHLTDLLLKHQMGTQNWLYK